MVKSILKFLAAGASAALVTFLAYISGHAPADVNPLVVMIVVALVTKLVNYLLGELPVPSA